MRGHKVSAGRITPSHSPADSHEYRTPRRHTRGTITDAPHERTDEENTDELFKKRLSIKKNGMKKLWRLWHSCGDGGGGDGDGDGGGGTLAAGGGGTGGIDGGDGDMAMAAAGL